MGDPAVYGASDKALERYDLLELVMTCASSRHVTDLFVARNHIVREGKLVTVDLEAAEIELQSMAKAALPSVASGDLMKKHLDIVAQCYGHGAIYCSVTTKEIAKSD